jgi:transcriptional regulator with XRE-family HTH domain
VVRGNNVGTEFGTERADRISAWSCRLVETGAFGETLKRAREERGVALDAVASATRIARRHLDALERGDLESLPSGPFGRSYLRSYAEFLGIDPEPMLQAYRSQEADRGLGPAECREKSIQELSRLLERRPVRKRSPPPWVLAALFAAMSLLTLRWLSRVEAPGIPAREAVIDGPAPVAASPAPSDEAEADRKLEPSRTKAPSPVGAIVVSESAVGTDVVNHTITGVTSRFSEGERVLFWTRVVAAQPGDVIHHYWLHDGRPVMRADLRIGGPHWRTFSRLTLPEGASGKWIVEARDESGRVLAREEFLCLERGG